jgi:hypothetical protein
LPHAGWMVVRRLGGRVGVVTVIVLAVALAVWLGLDYVGTHYLGNRSGEYTVF